METTARFTGQGALPKATQGWTYVSLTHPSGSSCPSHFWETTYSNVSNLLLDMAEVAQRFFHPSEYEEMLSVILPRFVGDDIDVSAVLMALELQPS